MSEEKKKIKREYAMESGQRILDFVLEELSLIEVMRGNSFGAGMIAGEKAALEKVRDFAMGIERD